MRESLNFKYKFYFSAPFPPLGKCAQNLKIADARLFGFRTLKPRRNSYSVPGFEKIYTHAHYRLCSPVRAHIRDHRVK